MIWFLYADISHLPLTRTVTIIAISGQKDAELLALLCQDSCVGSCDLAAIMPEVSVCVCVCQSIFKIANTTATQTDKVNQPHGHIGHRCTASEVKTQLSQG